MSSLQSIASKNQFHFLLGCILGDAYITPLGKIQIEQSSKQREYLYWKHQVLKDISYPKIGYVCRNDKRTNKTYSSYRFWTRQYFRELRRFFYPEGKKVFPQGIEKLLTPLSIATWYMDDGSKSNNNLIISTDSFGEDSLVKIIDYFESLNLKVSLKSNKKLFLNKASSKYFSDMVSPYLHKSMRYKLFDPVTTDSKDEIGNYP